MSNVMQLINYSYLLQKQAEAQMTNLIKTGSIGSNNIFLLYQSHNMYNFLFTVYGAIITYSKSLCSSTETIGIFMQKKKKKEGQIQLNFYI